MGVILDPLPTQKSDVVDGPSHGIFAQKPSSIALSKVMSIDQKPSMSADYTCENTAYAMSFSLPQVKTFYLNLLLDAGL